MTTLLPKFFLGLPGIFITLTGLVFLLNPEAAATKLALDAATSEGLSNLRGLAGAPLFAVGSTLLLAAATGKLEYARPGALFLVTLLAARVLSYVVDGPTDAIALFLAVPSVTFLSMWVGHKLIDRARATAA